MKLALLLLLAVPFALADLVINDTAGTIIDTDAGILIESLTSFVNIHADANEVELEGGEIHLHSPGEIHLEGEGTLGFVHIESRGTGQVLLESQTGNITLESFGSDIYVHADAGEVELEGSELHAHSPGEIHIEGEGANGFVHIESRGNGQVLLESQSGNITLESFQSDIYVHADAGEVELEGSELHAHSPGEIHIEGEGANGFVHIESRGNGQVLLESQSGNITLESFQSDIYVHADAGEVELEGSELHAHSPGEIHIEGEGADGFVHIESRGNGVVLLESQAGNITLESFASDIYIHADAGEVELEGSELHAHSPGEIHIEGEGANGFVHIESRGNGQVLLESQMGNITLESFQSDIYIHADNGEVELEGSELHAHSPGEIHIEGEGASGFVHIESRGTGQVLLESQTGNITLESFGSDIFVHADAGEVELEGMEVHAHSPGEVHIEGEGATGAVLIETTGGGDVTIRATGGGNINIGNGLDHNADCVVTPLPPAACGVSILCPSDRIMGGLAAVGCPAGQFRILCCRYTF